MTLRQLFPYDEPAVASLTKEFSRSATHADAFKAERRRVFTGDVVDWARNRPDRPTVFVAGDFNFELNAKDESHLYTDNVKNDSEAYSYILKYFRDLGREAGYTAVDDRRID